LAKSSLQAVFFVVFSVKMSLFKKRAGHRLTGNLGTAKEPIQPNMSAALLARVHLSPLCIQILAIFD
jgi:hypothetical protein